MAAVAARSLSLAMAYDDYDMLYVSDEIWYVNTARKILIEVFGFRGNLLQVSGVIGKDYYNLEHPPLGKYIIALSMALCGDKPLCWRLPGVIEASLIPLILAWGFRLRFPEAAVAAAAAAADPVLVTAGSVAMLDVHLAFFTALSLALMARGHMIPASIAAAAALSTKISAAPLAVLAIVYSACRRGVYYSIAILLTMILVYTMLWIPLGWHLGLETIIAANLGAPRYHTMPRPHGPPTSTPLGWILNVNPFYYSVGAITVPALTNTTIHLIAISSALILATLYMARRLGAVFPVASFTLIGIYAAYYIVFYSGNTTLYSFYSAQLTPVAAMVIGEMLNYLTSTGRR